MWYISSKASLTPQDIDWWSRYSASMSFDNEVQARNWIAGRLSSFDKSQGSIFGVDPEKNQFIAQNLPVYQEGRKWKVGRRIRTKKVFSWDSVDVRRNTLEELTTAGFLVLSDVEKLGPVELVSVSKLHETDSNTQYKNTGWIQSLAQQLKSGEVPYFKAIVYDANGFGLIDGHHRLQAVKLAGIKTIPAQYVQLYG